MRPNNLARLLIAALLFAGSMLPTALPSYAQAACGSMTPSETEGPYFKAGSPYQSDLAQVGVTGTPLHLSGYVLGSDCRPVAGATLDFWQADASGQYDNSGYNLRGHQTTDASGYYQLDTIEPGLYPGRTRHIHVKVQAPDGSVLTTQLYFPNDPNNALDSIFAENGQQLLLNVQQNADGSLAATFTFVLGSG
jgi:protocatechuate 3,4-dioxygenase beta subunit